MRRKVLAAVAVGMGFYALSDVLLWQRVFESHGLFQFDFEYQSGHVAMLLGLVGVGIVLLWETGLWALWYGGALYTLAFGGAADILYYWIDGRAIPDACPWLDASHNLILFHPAGAATLVASAAIWIGLWLGLLLFAPAVGQRLRSALRAPRP